MTAELLCLFKSSRRTEYTQENLRILSGAIGDEVGVAYKERWLSEDVRQRLPGPDDPVLIVLADPPDAKSRPIRKTCEPLMMKRATERHVLMITVPQPTRGQFTLDPRAGHLMNNLCSRETMRA